MKMLTTYPFGNVTLQFPLRLLVLACAMALSPSINAEAVAKEVDAKPKATSKKANVKKSAAEDVHQLEDMVVEAGRAKNLIGMTGSASQGEVSQAQFEYRPTSRNGELVEVVPGAVATQHSGSGKANQYYLRGYNLDHGTDFTTIVDGIPMNMTTHAHGQGYMDINSLIPELTDKIEYGKGPYYAEVGDFASAGYARMSSMKHLDQGIAKFTGGEYGFYRTLIANSNKLGNGDFLYGAEFNLYDGVWDQPEGSKKFNGMLRYTLDEGTWGVSVFAKGYHNTWTATNQIPTMLTDNGTLGLYSTWDNTDGGNSQRYSLSSNFWNKGDNWKNDANAYVLYYDVDLYSNFTGFLDNPVQGDQIHQFEHRVQTGGNFDHTRFQKLFGFDMDNTVGVQLRHDEIMDLGLDHTQGRQYRSTVSHNDASVTTVSAYLKNQTYWHEKVRTIAAVRGDFVNNDVTALATGSGSAAALLANSGHRGQMLISPKFNLVVGPWYQTEFFLNGGYGYHSNDARGTTLQIDPASGDKLDANASRIKPLAWSRGAETGFRTSFIPGLNSTLAFWWLESSQELVFVGDAGTTEVNGKSHRYGMEFSNYYKPTDWLTLDADLALTSARYADTPEGETNNFVPNSVGRVVSTGATVVAPNGIFGTIRLRHFGSLPLDNSGKFWSGDTNVVNVGTGYKHKQYKFEVDIFNIFNSSKNDIAYAYDYAYPAGSAAQTGILRHPVEPRMVRATISVNF